MMFTDSPFFRRSATVSKRALSALPAVVFVRALRSATAAISSDLFMTNLKNENGPSLQSSGRLLSLRIREYCASDFQDSWCFLMDCSRMGYIR